MQEYVVPLERLDRSSLPIAGGKGANLGELLRAGFPVPDGFCVTTAAYRRFVAAANIGDRVAALLARPGATAADSLAATGAAVRDLFYRAEVPADLQAAVLAAAAPLGLTPLAVRSSATAEDLPEASFAGQQETYLNVVGGEALLDAVRRCWASLWTDRAIAYRERNGIPHAAVTLAVIVQLLVPAEAAGVLFTANPVTGKRTEITIDASLGLGEAVVAGLVSPDNYAVDKRTLAVIAKHVAAKALRLVTTPGGGTARAPVPAAAGAVQALPDDAIRDLARLGASIEAHFGWPQDVEWALADGRLYILQSRPITSLYPAPPPAPNGSLRVHISLNAVQGMLEPLTPMGASLFTCGIRTVFYGGRPGPIALVDLGGRLFVDATPMLRNQLGRRLLLLVFPEVEPLTGRILAQLLEDPRLAPIGGSSRATALGFVWRYRRNVLLLVRRVASTIARPAWARRRVDEAIIPRAAVLRAELQRPIALGEEPEALRRVFRHGLADLFFRLVPLVAAGIACLKQAEMRVLAWGLDEKLLATARQGLPYNRTTTMDLDLWALAQHLKADAPSREAVAAHAPSALAALYREGSLPPTAQEGLAEFLSRYGHRAIREIDIGMPRWAEDPSYLFGVLQNYLKQEDPEAAPDSHFARQAAAADKVVAELVASARRLPGGWHKGPVLGLLLRRYRQLGGLRETPKFVLMYLFQAVRQLAQRTGAALVERGQLDRAEDVFFLRVEELERVGDASADLQAVVAQRRREYERELARPRSPRVLTSEGEAFYGEALSPSAGTLAGIGVSPGAARGRARIIRDPLGARLEPGEVLVAPSTDPAWTPLFLTAVALVMEAGGTMSHGSIVAREYGIPAVVGVAEATARLADGQQIEVDGFQGLVRVVEASAASTAVPCMPPGGPA